MDLSNLIVEEIIAINRVNRATGAYKVRMRPNCALCYKVEGLSTYTQDNRQFISDKTHLVFIPNNASYSYQCHENGECVIIEFKAQGANMELFSYAINNVAEVTSIIDKIERAHTFKKTGYAAYCLSGLYKLLYYMVSQNSQSYLANLKKKRIHPSLNYLESNYRDCSLSIRELAEVSKVSEVYFRKLFTQIFGMPPQKYIRLIRMTKAKELLLTRELRVQEVAEEVGFHNVYSFCKAFRKTYDCTPTEYRKSHWS